MSLEKSSSLPGKIKTIKIYATKGNNQEMGSVRASFRAPNGQTIQTLNVGLSIDKLLSNNFPNRVQDGGNNNSKKNTTDNDLENTNQVQNFSEPSLKRSHHQLQDGVIRKTTERASTPPSPVILYSPIRKRKTPKHRDSSGRAFPNHVNRQTLTRPADNLDQPKPSFIPQKKAKIQLKISEDLELNISDSVFKNVRKSNKSVKLSPIIPSSDDEIFVEDSILDFCNTPVPSPQNSGSVDFQNIEEEKDVPIIQQNYFNNIEDVTEDTVDLNMISKDAPSEDLVSEMGEKLKECDIISKPYEYDETMNTEKEKNDESLASDIGQDLSGEGGTILDNETEIIFNFQDVNKDRECSEIELKKETSSDKIQISKSVKINIKGIPKRIWGTYVQNDERNEQSFKVKSNCDEETGPSVLASNSSASPTSPPPQSWMSSDALFNLNVGDFLDVMGLCRLETARDINRKLNNPKA